MSAKQIVDPKDPTKFTIELVDATEDEKKLKLRFDQLRDEINQKADKPGAADLLQRLLIAERLALVGFDGKPADPHPALMSLGAIRADAQRLMLPPGRFTVSLPEGALRPEDRDIIFRTDGRPEPVPAAQLKLKSDIEDTLTTLQIIFPSQKREPWSLFGWTLTPGEGHGTRRFEEYRYKLFGLAQVGLEDYPSVETAQLALAGLQNEVVRREGPRIKNGYMRRLGLWALMLGGITAIAYLMVRNNDGFSVQLFAMKNLFLLWTGAMIGTWLSFGIRKPVITLADLGGLESDMVEPPLRLLFTGLIAITFGFIFLSGMVNVKIGTLDTVQLLNHGSIALAIGMLFGISEQALPGALTRRSSQFVSEVGGK